MAGKEISIDIAMNAREVQRGVKDVDAALEQVADSLDDVASDAQKAGEKVADGIGDGAKDAAHDTDRATRDISDSLDDVARDARKAGDKAGDELADGITDGAKDAADSTERVEKSFKDLADASKRETKAAGDNIKKHVEEGAEGASEAMGTFKDETVANLSQTVSSFRGDMGDIAQLAQDTLGGVVADLGPIGMAAGAAGAVGLGLVSAAFEKAQEKEEEFREHVSELASTMIEDGGDAARVLETMADSLDSLATETDKGNVNLEKLAKVADDLDVPFRDLTSAYADGGDALDAYIDLLDARIKSEGDAAAAAVEDARVANSARQTATKSLRDERDMLVEKQKEYDAATEKAKLQAETEADAMRARSELMDTYQGELESAMGSYGDFQDAETGAMDPAGYIAAMQARMDATTNFHANIQTLATQFGLTADEVQAIADQGVDFAPMLQSIIDSGMGEEYAEQVRAMLTGGQAIVDGTPVNANIEVQSDADDASAAIDDAAKDRSTNIKTDADTKPAAAAIDQVADKKRTATITTEADTSAASRALAAFITRQRSITIGANMNLLAAQQALDRFLQPRTRHVTADLRDREGKQL